VCYGLAIVARCLLGVAHRAVATMVTTWLLTGAKLVLLVLLVTWLHVLGAGIATLVGFFALMVTFLLMTRPVIAAHRSPADRAGRSPVAPWTLVATGLAAALASVPLYLLATPEPSRLLPALAAYAVVYAAALLALRVVRTSEIRTAWRMVVTHRSQPEARSPEAISAEEADATGLV
jgi:hypothetical protein